MDLQKAPPANTQLGLAGGDSYLSESATAYRYGQAGTVLLKKNRTADASPVVTPFSML